MGTVRVLHVIGAMQRGGAETRIMDLYRCIDRKRVQFDFCVFTDRESAYDEEIEAMGGKIYRLAPGARNLPRRAAQFYRLLSAHPEYKCVHMHMDFIHSTQMILLLIQWARRVPVRIAHSRSAPAKQRAVFHHLTRGLFGKLLTHRFAVSELAGIWLFGPRAVGKKQVQVLKNGVCATRFRYQPELRKAYREKFGLTDHFVVIHVGRLVEFKNHRFLFEVFREVCKERRDAKLVLVGGGVLEQSLKTLAEEMEIGQAVLFAGERKDVANLLQVGDVFVFPSFYEGLPGAVVEAQASGLPCLISDRITKEVCITPLATMYSLDKSAKEWAQKVLASAKIERRDTYAEIVAAGFDAGEAAKRLEQFYVDHVKKQKE